MTLPLVGKVDVNLNLFNKLSIALFTSFTVFLTLFFLSTTIVFWIAVSISEIENKFLNSSCPFKTKSRFVLLIRYSFSINFCVSSIIQLSSS